MKNFNRTDVRELIIGENWSKLRKLGFKGDMSDLGDWLNANEEPKYYWHIKSFKEHGYLNFYLDYNYITVDGNDEFSDAVITKFTESEYRDLSEQFGFDFNMFEREDID